MIRITTLSHLYLYLFTNDLGFTLSSFHCVKANKLTVQCTALKLSEQKFCYGCSVVNKLRLLQMQ